MLEVGRGLTAENKEGPSVGVEDRENREDYQDYNEYLCNFVCSLYVPTIAHLYNVRKTKKFTMPGTCDNKVSIKSIVWLAWTS